MKAFEIYFFLFYASVIVYVIGLLGLVFNRGNILKVIMALELLLLSVNLIFITFSLYLDDIVGQIFVLFILALSATESAIGLTILSVYHEHKNDVQLDPIKLKNKNLKL